MMKTEEMFHVLSFPIKNENLSVPRDDRFPFSAVCLGVVAFKATGGAVVLCIDRTFC